MDVYDVNNNNNDDDDNNNNNNNNNNNDVYDVGTTRTRCTDIIVALSGIASHAQEQRRIPRDAIIQIAQAATFTCLFCPRVAIPGLNGLPPPITYRRCASLMTECERCDRPLCELHRRKAVERDKDRLVVCDQCHWEDIT